MAASSVTKKKKKNYPIEPSKILKALYITPFNNTNNVRRNKKVNILLLTIRKVNSII